MKRIVAIIFLQLALLALCRSGGAHNRMLHEPSPRGEAQSDDALPLPAVPAALREPSARAAYVAEHFWDAMDFADTLRSRDVRFMERSFADFAALLPHADDAARRTAVATLMQRAEADSAAYVLLTDIAEKYLHESASPVASEECYILFLEHMVTSRILGEYGTLRPRWQLEAAMKNRPGTVAANFVYVNAAGRHATLHRTPVSDKLLLIFYDPDCPHCAEVLASLRTDERLASRVASGELSVLAVCSGGARDLWERTLPTLPAEWGAGYESGRIQERGEYVFRTMPALYLLDRDMRVLVKDADAARLHDMLQDE